MVRSTKETSRVEARRLAEELAQRICSKDAPADKEFSFRTYAQRLILKGERLVQSGERNKHYMRTTKLFLDNDDWGLVRHFETRVPLRRVIGTSSGALTALKTHAHCRSAVPEGGVVSVLAIRSRVSTPRIGSACRRLELWIPRSMSMMAGALVLRPSVGF